MSPHDQIEALEAAVMALAQQTAGTATIIIAQSFIMRALAEGLTRGSGTSIGDVHEIFWRCPTTCRLRLPLPCGQCLPRHPSHREHGIEHGSPVQLSPRCPR
jgi:hypothetical protein